MDLKQEIIRIPLKYFSPVIRLIENVAINTRNGDVGSNSPVFIVCGPRTGSTIVYQVLTNVFNVLYIDNLSYLAYRNLYFGMRLSHKIFKARPHNIFESNYGQTTTHGLHGPNEGDRYWNRFIAKDRHYVGYVNAGEVSDGNILRIRKELSAIINRFNKPFLFKFITAGLRLQLINEIYPDAKFIFLRRDPVYTIQSNLIARKKFKETVSTWWSLKPENYKALEGLPAVEQVTKQIYSIEKKIYNDKTLFPEKNWFELDYKDFMQDANGKIDEIGRKFDLKLREKFEMPELDYRDTQKLDDEIFNQIQEEVNKLDWNNYSTEL